jgi:hypothetical protein
MSTLPTKSALCAEPETNITFWKRQRRKPRNHDSIPGGPPWEEEEEESAFLTTTVRTTTARILGFLLQQRQKKKKTSITSKNSRIVVCPDHLQIDAGRSFLPIALAVHH